MSDTKIRSLQRKFYESGDLCDRDRLRAALLRYGKVDEALQVLVDGGFLTSGSARELKKSEVHQVAIYNMVLMPGQGHQLNSSASGVFAHVMNAREKAVSLSLFMKELKIE